MSKIDFKKTMPSYKAKKGEYELIDMPATSYLMVDGHGNPNNSAAFTQAIEALYPLAYALKFHSKNDHDCDYVVPPLEGLWYADDPEVFTTQRDKDAWKWTLMLMVPEWLTKENFNDICREVAAKKPQVNVDAVRYETLHEGLCVQTMHVGSFDDEGPVLEYLHNTFIPDNELVMAGVHHEIYLSDFRKVSPSRLKTILRQPVKRT